jgi:tetratricopeptide (TPR) repeat protein
MGMNDFLLNENEYSEIIERCEKMLKNRKQYYFDVHEFENLIDHYIDSHNLQKADKVTNIARRQHPSCIEIEFRKAKLLIEQQKYKAALKSFKPNKHNRSFKC